MQYFTDPDVALTMCHQLSLTLSFTCLLHTCMTPNDTRKMQYLNHRDQGGTSAPFNYEKQVFIYKL